MTVSSQGMERADLAATPIEGLVDNYSLRHATRIVAPVEGKVLARAPYAITEMRIAPDQSHRSA
jgi:hypothetical protein